MMKFPLGERGEWPVYFPCTPTWERIRELTSLPGIVRAPGGLRCTWDIAPFLAAWLDLPCPTIPTDNNVDLEAEILAMPGLSRYRELGLGLALRDYQKEDAVFMARRAFALNCNPMRSGKSFSALAASVLTGAERTLIIGPAISKCVWADEIAKWLKEETLILEGRGGDTARRFCLTCQARGRINGERCPDCRLRNGQSRGYRLYDVFENSTERDALCRKHHDVAVAPLAQCQQCLRDLNSAIDASRFVCVNYDLLVSQRAADGAGRAYYRDELPGWGPTLAKHHFDLCISDESHHLRGFSTELKKKGTTRREKFCQVTDTIPQVWGLTGTPIYGYVRDLWGQIDAISKGAVTGNSDRLPFKFHSHFCLPGEAPVWMADMTFKPISDIKAGNTVWGWDWPESGRRRKFVPTTVREVFTRQAEVIEVTMASGRKIRCTPDHVWASGRTWASALKGQLRWTRAEAGVRSEARTTSGQFASGNSRWGACLARVADSCETLDFSSAEYALGYIQGALDGDGAIRDDWHMRPGRCVAERVLDTVLRVNDKDFADRYSQMLSKLGVDTNVVKLPTMYKVWAGRDSVALYYKPREGGDDYWRGYLGGVYDAEGSGYVFAQYRHRNPAVYDNIALALRRFGFDVRENPEDITVRGGRSEFIRMWNTIRPALTRKLVGVNQNKSSIKGAMSIWTGDDVVETRSLGEQTVYCVKTDTSNFVVYGYASHNCDGHKGEYGWIADGRSHYADTELPTRLAVFKIQRQRKDILASLPAKIRQVIRIDDNSPSKSARYAPSVSNEGKITRLLRGTFDAKVDTVVENVIAEAAEGNKVVVFTLMRESAEKLSRRLNKDASSRENRTKMREVDMRIWLAHGGTSTQGRFEMARSFREHQGAGVMVATIDAVQVAISLNGATSVHFAELHWQPSAMLQAEDRPYEVGITGLTIVYYIVKDSIDEHVEQVVLPKVETLARVVNEAGANEIRDAMVGTEKETLAQLLASLTAHIQT